MAKLKKRLLTAPERKKRAGVFVFTLELMPKHFRAIGPSGKKMFNDQY